VTGADAQAGPRTVPRPEAGPACSVVLCTLGSNPGLARAVEAVLTQHGVDLELVVVDNDPRSGRTAAVLHGRDDVRLRRVEEPRRGLSAARNAGLRAARGTVVAFTDDDCVPEEGWLRAVLDLFDGYPEIAAVTGLTVPDDDPTPVQELFEEFGSFDRGPDRRVWHFPFRPHELTPALARLGVDQVAPPVFPYSGVYGSGNNMALRTSAIRTVGGFDEALGAGSPAAGGEDLDMFVRLMLAGLVLVYEPAAVVRHSHRPDLAALTRQVQGYGSGLAAMITKYLLTGPASRRQVLARALPGLGHLLRPGSPKNLRKSKRYPSRLTRSELAGCVSGPWLYLRGRRVLRRSGLAAVPPAGLQLVGAEPGPHERVVV